MTHLKMGDDLIDGIEFQIPCATPHDGSSADYCHELWSTLGPRLDEVNLGIDSPVEWEECHEEHDRIEALRNGR